MIRARQGASNCATRVPMRPKPTSPMVWPAKAVRCPAADVIGEVLLLAPLAGADVGVALAQLLEQRQHEGDGGLGDAEAVGLGRRVAHHHAEVGRRFGVDVIDADRVFRDHAQALRRLHDAAADRGVADRRAHQRDRVAGGFHHLVLHVAGARQLPLVLAEDDLAAQAFERLDGLGRLLAPRENQNLGLGHECSVLGCWSVAMMRSQGRSIQLDSAVLENLAPAVRLLAQERVEFLRRRADRADAGLLQRFGDCRIVIHRCDLALNLLDDGARRAGGRDKPDPGRNVVERRIARLDGQRPHVRAVQGAAGC